LVWKRIEIAATIPVLKQGSERALESVRWAQLVVSCS
jgi:hypothetical protein